MDLQNDANVLTCNLVKIMHHTQSMQFVKKIVNIYDITIGDLILARVQKARYRDYLMGRSKGHGLDNYELHLRATNHLKDLHKIALNLFVVLSF
jgi:hypothetical protein